MNRPIFLFTTAYPYGHGETFLENEIPILIKEFGEVHVVPLHPIGKSRVCPDGLVVIDAFKDYNYKRKLNLSILLKLFYVLVFGFNRGNWISKNWSGSVSAILRTINRSDYLFGMLNSISNSENAIYYSYWMSEWALIISLLPKKVGKNAKFVSRAHGFDLYDNRVGLDHRVNKSFILNKFHGVYTVSNQGSSYLKQSYSRYSQKISTAYLGTRAPNNKKDIEEKERFTIVSCSSLIPLKRVGLIISTLMHIKEDVLWVHHGTGPLEEELKKAAMNLPDNVEVRWMGNVDNSSIHDFYASNPIDLFVLLSSTEGLPMSIMEAHSYGIPSICTNVGGVSEIINEKNGVLLRHDFNIDELLSAITGMIHGEVVFDSNTIVSSWRLNFSLHNYSCFCDKIRTL